jgi:hypothetical protein
MKNLSRHTDDLCELETSLLMSEHNRVDVSPPHLRTETNPVPETLSFLVV